MGDYRQRHPEPDTALVPWPRSELPMPLFSRSISPAFHFRHQFRSSHHSIPDGNCPVKGRCTFASVWFYPRPLASSSVCPPAQLRPRRVQQSAHGNAVRTRRTPIPAARRMRNSPACPPATSALSFIQRRKCEESCASAPGPVSCGYIHAIACPREGRPNRSPHRCTQCRSDAQ